MIKKLIKFWDALHMQEEEKMEYIVIQHLGNNTSNYPERGSTYELECFKSMKELKKYAKSFYSNHEIEKMLIYKKVKGLDETLIDIL